MTGFSNKCKILGKLWFEYRVHPDLEDFIEYNDMGLPLAYFISEKIVSDISDNGKQMIDETFNLLLEQLDITDEGFEDLDELFDLSEEVSNVNN